MSVASQLVVWMHAIYLGGSDGCALLIRDVQISCPSNEECKEFCWEPTISMKGIVYHLSSWVPRGRHVGASNNFDTWVLLSYAFN
jgi:hypothetical protein